MIDKEYFADGDGVRGAVGIYSKFLIRKGLADELSPGQLFMDIRSVSSVVVDDDGAVFEHRG